MAIAIALELLIALFLLQPFLFGIAAGLVALVRRFAPQPEPELSDWELWEADLLVNRSDALTWPEWA
jgi:hypothetical protein